MDDDIRAIIERAQELSALIRAHETTRRYESCRARMNNDRKAQDLYARLVAMGRDVNAALSGGGDAARRSTETELLQKELERNPLVIEFISSQKGYLELLKMVIDRIREPSA